MSTKSLAEKLLIKPNTTVWSSHASRLDLIQPLPENVRHVDRLEQATTTALVFADDAGSLRDILTAHKDQLARPSSFWVAYPKANRADLNRDSLWPILGEYGMRPTWAGVGGRGLVRDALPPTQGRRGVLHGWAITNARSRRDRGQ